MVWRGKRLTLVLLKLGIHSGSMVKNLPEVQETQVRFLGREDLEKEMQPLQYSCLRNPVDRGTWWVTDHGVAESDTTGVTEHFLS